MGIFDLGKADKLFFRAHELNSLGITDSNKSKAEVDKLTSSKGVLVFGLSDGLICLLKFS